MDKEEFFAQLDAITDEYHECHSEAVRRADVNEASIWAAKMVTVARIGQLARDT